MGNTFNTPNDASYERNQTSFKITVTDIGCFGYNAIYLYLDFRETLLSEICKSCIEICDNIYRYLEHFRYY